MCECLEPRSDYYAEIVLHNNGFSEYVESISRYSLKNMLVEAYKQGYRDANKTACWDNKCNQTMRSIPPECMSKETAKELENILAKVHEKSVKYAMVQKDLQEIIRQVNAQHPPKDLGNYIQVSRNGVELLADKNSDIEVEDIIRITAEIYGVTVDDIMGESRKRNVAEARQMAMLLCHQKTYLSLTDIGIVLGRKHPTVIHSINKMNDLMEVDNMTKDKYDRITERLNDKG